jgi:hypothetical protein
MSQYYIDVDVKEEEVFFGDSQECMVKPKVI